MRNTLHHWHVIMVCYHAHRRRREIAALSDAALKDLGIDRSEMYSYALQYPDRLRDYDVPTSEVKMQKSIQKTQPDQNYPITKGSETYLPNHKNGS